MGVIGVAAKFTLKELPAAERPRERLFAQGADALSDAELLALLIGTGQRGETAIDVARRLLQLGGADAVAEDPGAGMRYLDEAPAEELSQVPGVGQAKAARLKAAFELAHRLGRQQPERPIVRGPGDAAKLLMTRLRHRAQEEFHVVHLNTKNHVLATSCVSVGTLDSASAHPREIFRAALKRGCASIILVHNHPSGDPTPSPEDIAVTRRLVEVGQVIGIDVLDHVIIGHNRYLSLRERGLL